MLFAGKNGCEVRIHTPISINLRKLQEILDPNNTMDIDVSNLGLRLIACEETAVLWELKCHLLDLKFGVYYFNLVLPLLYKYIL